MKVKETQVNRYRYDNNGINPLNSICLDMRLREGL